MSNVFKINFIVLFLMTLFSCSFISFEELESCISIRETANYYDKDYIKIDFSIELKKESVESLISLVEDGNRLDTNISWQSNSCIVKPVSGLKKGCKYNFSLQGKVYSEDEREYSVNYYREFIFGKEEDSFKLVNVEENKDLHGDLESLVFIFNKAVEPGYFDREFNISPYIEIKKEWSSAFDSVRITPTEKWKTNTYYTWTLGNIFSSDGTKIFMDYHSSFLGAKKDKGPELISVCPVINGLFLNNTSLNSLLEKQSVGFIFDCEMNLESIERGIYFTPSVEGYWTKENECQFIFTPYKNYQIQTDYRLTVSDAVEDKWGLNLKNDKNIYFRTNNDFITIAQATLNTVEIHKDIENKISLGHDLPVYVKITFSNYLAEKSLLEIRNCIRFEGMFPSSAQNPRLDSIRTINDRCVEFSFSNINSSDSEKEKIYKITIKGGEKTIYDAHGSYLKEDICFYVKIN